MTLVVLGGFAFERFDVQRIDNQAVAARDSGDCDGVRAAQGKYNVGHRLGNAPRTVRVEGDVSACDRLDTAEAKLRTATSTAGMNALDEQFGVLSEVLTLPGQTQCAHTDGTRVRGRPRMSGYSIKTYRYLRMAMVAMILLLAAALVIEWSKTDPRCLQTSISAYYYTPVRAIFVGCLITIGMCMVVLKGNTETEDILLNVAGILAPGVALVPTPGQGSCHSVPVELGDAAANVSNNMLALFVVGVPCLLLTAYFIIRDRMREPAGWTPMYVVGLGIAVLIFGGGLAWFLADRSGFIGNAHYAAAIVMFLCIIVVVLANAEQFRRKQHAVPRSLANRYSVIALAMVVLPLLMVGWRALFGWAHAVLWIEGTLIVLFAAFWISQTQELWNEGLRQELPRSPQATPSPLRSSSRE
ncbi:DUF998 domain-containing protein [Kribbella solani]|uniref:DUF998 domain-containing protein n=1 Tax=Kribbella solani TaxID=236067 RepID=UPI0029BA5039|nr:DUF998 domain-containing protein [Kribbella solani]MDX3006102.1 DUF998 domain-containing protein [Kribbella solani]